MKNFEVQHTIRIYDPQLISEIGKTYQSHKDEYDSKNAFLTELLRLGLKAINSNPPGAPASGEINPKAFEEFREAINRIKELNEETSKYMTVQFQRANVQADIAQRLLSSIYHMKIGELNGFPTLASKVEDGFFDDLPFRFGKIIIQLEKNNAA